MSSIINRVVEMLSPRAPVIDDTSAVGLNNNRATGSPSFQDANDDASTANGRVQGTIPPRRVVFSSEDDNPNDGSHQNDPRRDVGSLCRWKTLV